MSVCMVFVKEKAVIVKHVGLVPQSLYQPTALMKVLSLLRVPIPFYAKILQASYSNE